MNIQRWKETSCSCQQTRTSPARVKLATGISTQKVPTKSLTKKNPKTFSKHLMDNQKKREKIFIPTARVAVSVLRKARHSFITYQKRKKKPRCEDAVDVISTLTPWPENKEPPARSVCREEIDCGRAWLRMSDGETNLYTCGLSTSEDQMFGV